MFEWLKNMFAVKPKYLPFPPIESEPRPPEPLPVRSTKPNFETTRHTEPPHSTRGTAYVPPAQNDDDPILDTVETLVAAEIIEDIFDDSSSVDSGSNDDFSGGGGDFGGGGADDNW